MAAAGTVGSAVSNAIIGGVASSATTFSLGTMLKCMTGKCVRDGSGDQAIFAFNKFDNPDTLARWREYFMVESMVDPNNSTAIFASADGVKLGRLDGYPTRHDNGIMHGDFSIPGLDDGKDVEGQWIQVDLSVADEKTTCAYNKALELAAKGELSADNVDDMMEDLKAAHC